MKKALYRDIDIAFFTLFLNYLKAWLNDLNELYEQKYNMSKLTVFDYKNIFIAV